MGKPQQWLVSPFRSKRRKDIHCDVSIVWTGRDTSKS